MAAYSEDGAFFHSICDVQTGERKRLFIIIVLKILWGRPKAGGNAP